VLQNV